MTTKLTEAEVKALPVCKKCKAKPTLFSGTDVQCGGMCDVPILRVDTWILLMTPEAKGEMNFPKAIEFISQGFEEKERLRIENGGLVAARAILQSRVDFLQSNLAKSEEQIKVAEGERDSLAAKVKQLEAEAVEGTEALHLECWASTEAGKKNIVLCKEIASLKQQLAEATKPVREEELEKVIARLWNHMKYWTMEGGKETQQQNLQDYNTIIRAARQRKPSGDAVKLAEMVQDNFHINAHEWNKAMGLVDSILTQAGDNKEYEVTQDSGARMNQLLSDRDNARVPAADLLTAEERDNAEKIASSGSHAFWSAPAVSVAVALLRLAPAPSAATPD